MFNTEDTYEVVIFSIGDTKAGTKMGKLQLKNTKDDSILNCILYILLSVWRMLLNFP